MQQDSGTADNLAYRAPSWARRYTGKSIAVLIAGILTGPLVMGPMLFVVWLVNHADARGGAPERMGHELLSGINGIVGEAWSNSLLFVVAMTFGALFAVGIPYVGIKEAARLRRATEAIRGTKVIRLGLMVYSLWMIIPLSCLMLPVLMISPLLGKALIWAMLRNDGFLKLLDRWNLRV